MSKVEKHPESYGALKVLTDVARLNPELWRTLLLAKFELVEISFVQSTHQLNFNSTVFIPDGPVANF